MAVQTTSNDQAFKAARYSFLARPPPPQKKRPTQPLPSPPIAIALPLSAPHPPSPPLHRRPSNIAAWAALVQPGSPAPRSPHRRPSTSSSRRPSLTRIGRRPSISHSRAPSGSFAGLISNPTSAQDIDVNLSALGYTSVFVHIPPKTPSTPSPYVFAVVNAPLTPASASIQPPSPKKSKASRTVKRFRSMGILRPRSKSTSRSAALPSPTKPSSVSVRARAELIAKRKKAKYAHACPPPPLANEIALMQFAEGGTVEKNIHRMMEAQARAAGGDLGVADVYRDGKGGIWWDQDEEMEYAHLLGGDVAGQIGESQWVKFGSGKNEDDISPKTGLIDLADPKRESLSTQDSDLDPRYLVLPAEETQCGPEDIILSFSPKSPFRRHSPIVPGVSVLSLPSRPRRAAKHLRKPDFLLDLAAFGPRSPEIQIRISPKSPLFPSSPRTASSPYSSRPRTPKSARFSSAFAMPPSINSSGSSQKAGGKKVRRRPAPLKLSAASASAGWKKVEASPLPSAAVIAEARREFVEASFAPKPTVHRVRKSSVAPASNPPVPVNVKPTQEKPQRGKIIMASLDASDDTRFELCTPDSSDVSVSNNSSGGVVRKKKMGLGGLFGRK